MHDDNPDKPTPRYWFPAKRYGYGWGVPSTWEGWVVFVTWFVLMLGLSPVLAIWNIVAFIVFLVVMLASLLTICYLKGEPPSWRWGGDSEPTDAAG